MRNGRLLFWAITSALAGFLFGFDTIVISGAEQTIQELWKLGGGVHGLAISMALWGTVLGSLCGGWPTERLGRRSTLLWIGLLYFVSAVGSALAPEIYSFMLARFIGGVGVGMSTVAAPLYISEISPPKYRGRLAGMFQFNIVFGILVAFLSNWLLKTYLEDNAWRWMLGVEAIPALVYTAFCFGLPESPRWLITHGQDREAGLRIFRQLNPAATEEELNALADEVAASVTRVERAEKFFTMRLRIPILLAFLIAFFNQLSGINAVLYFAPRIFQLTGLDERTALLQSAGIGVTNLVFTFVGLYLIDRLGRRTLLYIGSFGYILSLGLCAGAFYLYAAPFQVASQAIALQEAVDRVDDAVKKEWLTEEEKEEIAAAYGEAKESLVAATSDPAYSGEPVVFAETADTRAVRTIAEEACQTAGEAAGLGGLGVLLCIFAFIAAHAVGQGAVIWVFISEIFPNRNRAADQALGSSTHWVFAALITLVFPKVITTFAPAAVFAFFCFMMVLQLLWVQFMVPETKGVPLEEMQEKLGIQ